MTNPTSPLSHTNYVTYPTYLSVLLGINLSSCLNSVISASFFARFLNISQQNLQISISNQYALCLNSIDLNPIWQRRLPLVYKALNLTQKVFHKTSYALQMELAFKLNPLKCILCGSAMRLIDITVGKTAKELRNYMHDLASMRPVH